VAESVYLLTALAWCLVVAALVDYYAEYIF
jgi:hypothetical protein